MATTGTYYLNAATLADATAVFSDAAMTTCAPDGYYSDGTIVRELLGCVLQPVNPCPLCVTECSGTTITFLATPGTGVFDLDIDTGSALGAIIIEFNPVQVPMGFMAFFGTTYNGLSSSLHGWLQSGDPFTPTYLGETASDCGMVAGSPHSLDEYEYISGSFQATSNILSVTVTAPELQLTAVSPTKCIMVIPKATNFNTIVHNTITSVCGSPGNFEVTVNCPAPLISWASGKVEATGDDACLSPATKTSYVAHVNGAAGVLGMYDLVFADQNGVTPLSAGFYNTGAMSGSWNWVEVDANGVVIGFGVCGPETRYIVERCYSSPADQRVITTAMPLSIGDFVLLDATGYGECSWEVISTTLDPEDTTFLGMATGDCTDQCSQLKLTNTGLVDIEMIYTACDGTAVSGIFITPGDVVRICAREYDAIIPADLTIEFENCSCDYTFNYLLSLCGEPATEVVASSDTEMTIGWLVKVSDPAYADCWFEVLAEELVDLPTTNIVDNNAGAFGCEDTCVRYEAENTGLITATVEYTTCDDTPMTVSVGVGLSVLVCARPGTVSVTAGTGTVTFIGCDCGGA
jgi:hypothetical protein